MTELSFLVLIHRFFTPLCSIHRNKNNLFRVDPIIDKPILFITKTNQPE